MSESSAAECSTDTGAQVALEDIGLRAATEADADFLREVFSSTRVDEFVRAGLPAEQIEPLLANQFSIQHDYYRRHYPVGRFDVITYGGIRVGRLYHDWSGDAAQLIDIALLPAYRGMGIGSHLMRGLVREAACKHVPMRLYVEHDNPVRALYRRLGFVTSGENGIYELMVRAAMPFDEEGPRQSSNDDFQSSAFA
ncbi:GNAT family N-acetyltransferase [Dyella mobilis]|uniref:GNAT family N-acetyltransferase n=1 Tax=Dyella mobilis TaxID=1849582 RepID=A0ABS2KCN2_9GAMM|nr:GNAT family N-acetyltransferase [Dyella mobilis]MBM7128936.1 GNAT family N-acetyltransferase [Dyella mobilis]